MNSKNLVQQLHHEQVNRRRQTAVILRGVKESNREIVSALEHLALHDPDQQVREEAKLTLKFRVHRSFVQEAELLPLSPPATPERQLSPEEKTARNWYRWLWLSPLLTLPTLTMLFLFSSGSIGFSVIGSSLWHLLLLFPTSDKNSAFVRWHGAQAMLLAVARTLIALAALSGDDLNGYLSLLLVAVWFFGTRWGQRQASRGDCTLIRHFGRAEDLPAYQAIIAANHIEPAEDAGDNWPAAADSSKAEALTKAVTPAKIETVGQAMGSAKIEAPAQAIDSTGAEALIEIVRYNPDPAARRQAVADLKQLGLTGKL